MPGLIGKKIGMTSVFGADGKNIPCTVIEAGPCVVTQLRHFKKAGTTPKRKLVEFPADFEGELKLGDTLTVGDIMSDVKYVDVVGTSKGKGFQGVVHRYHFAGVGGATHGQHNRLRKPGSLGASSWPSRVFPGMRMGGHMGHERVKVFNLEVVKIIPENNILVIKGSVPGARGSYVALEF